MKTNTNKRIAPSFSEIWLEGPSVNRKTKQQLIVGKSLIGAAIIATLLWNAPHPMWTAKVIGVVTLALKLSNCKEKLPFLPLSSPINGWADKIGVTTIFNAMLLVTGSLALIETVATAPLPLSTYMTLGFGVIALSMGGMTVYSSYCSARSQLR